MISLPAAPAAPALSHSAPAAPAQGGGATPTSAQDVAPTPGSFPNMLAGLFPGLTASPSTGPAATGTAPIKSDTKKSQSELDDEEASKKAALLAGASPFVVPTPIAPSPTATGIGGAKAPALPVSAAATDRFKSALPDHGVSLQESGNAIAKDSPPSPKAVLPAAANVDDAPSLGLELTNATAIDAAALNMPNTLAALQPIANAANAEAPAEGSQGKPKSDAGYNTPVLASTAKQVDAEPGAFVHEAAKPAPLADQVHDTFRSHLEQLQQQGRVEVHMDLHPPELGRMQLHLTMDDNHVNVRMVVQDDNAKRVLEQQAEPLRVRFNEMGVNLGQLDVRRDGNTAQQQDPEAESRSASTVQKRLGAARARTGYPTSPGAASLIDVVA